MGYRSPAAMYAQSASALNMKGKRTKKLPCGCCVLIDYRATERLARIKREMREAEELSRIHEEDGV